MDVRDAGRLGGLKGGRKRAEILSPEARKAIARVGAATRWYGGNSIENIQAILDSLVAVYQVETCDEGYFIPKDACPKCGMIRRLLEKSLRKRAPKRRGKK